MASTQRGSNTHKAATGGHFELAIDGHATTAYLKTVDGGYIRAGSDGRADRAREPSHQAHVGRVDRAVLRRIRPVRRERRAALDPAVVAQGVVAP